MEQKTLGNEYRRRAAGFVRAMIQVSSIQRSGEVMTNWKKVGYGCLWFNLGLPMVGLVILGFASGEPAAVVAGLTVLFILSRPWKWIVALTGKPREGNTGEASLNQEVESDRGYAEKARSAQTASTRSPKKSVMGLMCPYCLSEDGIYSKADSSEERFTCPGCKTIIPREYVRNPATPRETISVVGFQGHGKTVYIGSLFHTMNDLASVWPGFYTFAVDEKSLETVRQNSKLLKAGELPAATSPSFPIPTIVRFSNIPSLGDRFFLFYDTSGEAYEKQSALIQYAGFVRRSRAVIFILSLDDLKRDDQKMHDLLSTYVQGLTELNGNTEKQHLIVVLSKGDKLKKRLEEHEDIWRYLEEGSLDKLGNRKLGKYVDDMKRISRGLRDFVSDEMGEAQFLNFAEDRFRSVEFSIISALGAAPAGSRLQVEITPKRILDPILWVAHKSTGTLP